MRATRCRSAARLAVDTENVRLGPPLYARGSAQPGDYVAICCPDTGTGMTEEVRAKVFEPFFTTKEIGKGSGLGLSQVLGFAKQSGGGVRIESTVGERDRGTHLSSAREGASRRAESRIDGGSRGSHGRQGCLYPAG